MERVTAVQLQCTCEMLVGPHDTRHLHVAAAAAHLAVRTARALHYSAKPASAVSPADTASGAAAAAEVWARQAWATVLTRHTAAPVADATPPWRTLLTAGLELAQGSLDALTFVLRQLAVALEAVSHHAAARRTVLPLLLTAAHRTASHAALYATDAHTARLALDAAVSTTQHSAEQLLALSPAPLLPDAVLVQVYTLVAAVRSATATSSKSGQRQQQAVAGLVDGPGTDDAEVLPSAHAAGAALARALRLSSSLAAAPLPTSGWQLYRLARRLAVHGQYSAAAPLFAQVARGLESEQQRGWCRALAKVATAEAAMQRHGLSAVALAASQLLEGATDLNSTATAGQRLVFQGAYLAWRARVLQLLGDAAALRPDDARGLAVLLPFARTVQDEGSRLVRTAPTADGTTLALLAVQQRLVLTLIALTGRRALPPQRASAADSPVVPATATGCEQGTTCVHGPLACAVDALAADVRARRTESAHARLSLLARIGCPLPPLFLRVSSGAELQLGLRATSAYGPGAGAVGAAPASGARMPPGVVKLALGTDLVLDLDGLVVGMERRHMVQAMLQLTLAPRQLPPGQTGEPIRRQASCDVRDRLAWCRACSPLIH